MTQKISRSIICPVFLDTTATEYVSKPWSVAQLRSEHELQNQAGTQPICQPLL